MTAASDPRESYEAIVARFDVAEALSVLAGDGGTGWNAAHECCDRWCGEERIALHWANEHGDRGTLTFDELRRRSSRIAAWLTGEGVAAGDRVAGLLPRTPDLLALILGVWRIGAVYQPLFTAFGPKAIEHRLNASGAKIVVTDPVNRAKLTDVTSGARIAVTVAHDDGAPDDIVLANVLERQPESADAVRLGIDAPFLIMFTSGTTGPAKPLTVPLRALAAFVGYMRDAVDLRPDDAFWNIADPGWAYGLYYGVSGPLAMGHATLFYSGAFSASAAVEIVREFGITNLAGAPTAFRLLVSAGPAVVAPIAHQLRVVSSAGEPLNPDIVAWFAEYLHVPIHDHYGQTELGMVVCNHHALAHPVSPASAGFAVPGHRVVVLDDDDHELAAHCPGILAVDIPASPLYWFGGYALPDQPPPERYYRSGDTVERNDDGSISFVGRADDVITSSGYRIGPFDVESALLEHPAVLEAAVIGKPDAERTEIVKAFVVAANDADAGPVLVRTLQDHVRARLSAHAYPREIDFVAALPKTPSGKVQRFLLRAQEKARMVPVGD